LGGVLGIVGVVPIEFIKGGYAFKTAVIYSFVEGGILFVFFDNDIKYNPPIFIK
jgi:hypothetical protein